MNRIHPKEKQKLKETIDKMNVEELTEIAEYIFHTMRNTQVRKSEKEQTEELNLYSLFEKEFGRPLSPFEIESLNIWIDQDYHDKHLIKAALREAILAGKINIKYIDRILLNWKKNGVKTVKQAKEYSRNFLAFGNKQKETKNTDETPIHKDPTLYNWLKD